MTESPQPPEPSERPEPPTRRAREADKPEEISTRLQLVGWVLLALPVLGIAWHLYLLAGPLGLVEAYTKGPAAKIVGGLAVVNVLATWIHYRWTHMKVTIVARVATYLWLISVVLLFRRVYPDVFQW